MKITKELLDKCRIGGGKHGAWIICEANNHYLTPSGEFQHNCAHGWFKDNIQAKSFLDGLKKGIGPTPAPLNTYRIFYKGGSFEILATNYSIENGEVSFFDENSNVISLLNWGNVVAINKINK